jgi:hypothetical protein
MKYANLVAGAYIEENDEILDGGAWRKCDALKDGDRAKLHVSYRRPITETVEKDNTSYVEYTAPGILVSIHPLIIEHDKKAAAAFLGAIAMMLDGQAES